MPEFYQEKLDECMRLLAAEIEALPIAPGTIETITRAAAPTFQTTLTDDTRPDGEFGPIAWRATEVAVKTRVRALAALSEGYALDEGAAAVTVEHVARALAVVRDNCLVETERLKGRRFQYCVFNLL